ncbi:hypothetical protein [Dyella sp.]|uniref:hypothetical protein n=1 Tax=Dyella sp. TaxID=1869338 RepID=UPI002B4980D0|nr:hypothetical protein [Dyella sp.]HKT28695.1 hypothetical protein [Dyella sp.]
MDLLKTFSLKPHPGPRESWGRKSELLLSGKSTGKSIPGLVLEAQYRCASGYLFVTSWDCGDDSLDVIFADKDLRVLDRKSIGAMYDSTWLESHEVVSGNQVLLHCDNDFLIRVTVDGGLFLHQKYGELLDFIPYPSDESAIERRKRKPWWRLWQSGR